MAIWDVFVVGKELLHQEAKNYIPCWHPFQHRSLLSQGKNVAFDKKFRKFLRKVKNYNFFKNSRQKLKFWDRRLEFGPNKRDFLELYETTNNSKSATCLYWRLQLSMLHIYIYIYIYMILNSRNIDVKKYIFLKILRAAHCAILEWKCSTIWEMMSNVIYLYIRTK